MSYATEGKSPMQLWSTHQNRHVLAYEDSGKGPVVVLLHAFPLSGEMFAPQRQSFKWCRLLTPDLFGFGGTPALAADWSMDQIADTLADWLECVAPEQQVILGGVSMGGYVALALARRHPRKLRGLLLIDTRAEPDSPEAQANRAKSIDLVQNSGTAALVEGMLPKVLGKTTHETRPQIVQQVRTLGGKQKPEGVVAALKALRDRPDARPTLRNIEVPTLVIVGKEDVLTPPDVAEVLATGIPKAELKVLDGVGHLPNLEDPELFDSTVRTFAEKLFN
jgi:3-oxoadipate enol-lactonase